MPPWGAVRIRRVTRSADTRLGALLVVLVLAINVLAVSSRLGFLHKPNQVKEYDHRRYIEMAKGAEGRPALQREPPYCFRLAVPALVRGLTRLGMSVNAGFFLVTNAVLFGFLLVLWLHLRDLGFAVSLRVTGLLVVGLTQGAVRWFEYQYWMTDPAALFLVMLAFFLIERGKDEGPPGREPPRGVRARDLHPRLPVRLPARAAHRPAVSPRPSRGTAALAALPIAILVAIRRLVTPNQPDDFVSGIVDSMTFRTHHLLDNQLYVVTLGAFGVLVPLVLLFPTRLPGLARRHFDRALYVLSVYATLVISNNNERPLAYALPALVPAALWCLRAFLDETRLPARPVLAARRGAPGRLLGRPALGRDRHEHLPAGQLDDGRGPGGGVARRAVHPRSGVASGRRPASVSSRADTFRLHKPFMIFDLTRAKASS